MMSIIPGTKLQLHVAVLGNASDDAVNERAKALADQLELDFVIEPGTETELVLAYGEGGLELRDLRDRRLRPVCIDFMKTDVRPYGANLSRRQPLARAMGKKNKTIIDATAGLGQDAFLLAAFGYRVAAIERHSVLAVLLQDALARVETGSSVEKALGDRLSVICGDARQLITEQPAPDVIYLDPMFPPKRSKSALARKEMRMVRDLVGDDHDAPQLLEVALGCARNRVVVKRPQHARSLHTDPDFTLAGKLVRYDVYVTM